MKKEYIYPVVILVIIGFIGFSVISIVHRLGLQVNPPQPDMVLEAGLKPYVVWQDEEGWKSVQEGEFSMFKSETSHLKGVDFNDALKLIDPEVILLMIKEDIAREKARDLLELLAQHKIKKVYVVSPFDNTLVNLKKIEPRFWYAPSPKTWIKWSLFSSFYLDTIYDSKADFLFIDQKIKEILSPKLRNEIKRRNLLIVETSDADRSIILD